MTIIDTLIFGFVLSILILCIAIFITSSIVILGYYIIPIIIVLYVVGWLANYFGFEL
jgi:antibiotic biosynthesis monooxygenase (ABM) superfamily enzyme